MHDCARRRGQAVWLTIGLLAVAGCQGYPMDGRGYPGGPSAGPSGVMAGGRHAPRAPGQAMEPQRWDRQAKRHNTEAYDEARVNPMTSVFTDPRSTFAIDVDTASYSNVRRLLDEGRLPPAGAVRIEEMVNCFRYDYPQPEGDAPFSIDTEVTECPWRASHRIVRIGLRGKDVSAAERRRANLVFLIDVSGSMNSDNKLGYVKQAMKMLTRTLVNGDRVAIVVYAGASGVALPSTPASNQHRIHDAIDQLHASGSTNGGAGIRLAYRIARENFIRNGTNRVMLCTDGDFNVGVIDRSSLVRLIEQQARSGVELNILGFGSGNYKDATMESLSNRGNGSYAYIDSLQEARRVLSRQLGVSQQTIARDVKVQVEFNPATVRAYRLIGYENRVLRHQDFRDDRKDAGEIAAGHTVTALYEVVPMTARAHRDGERATIADSLRYQAPRQPTRQAYSDELMTVSLRYKLPQAKPNQASRSREVAVTVRNASRPLPRASADTRFAVAVASLGMKLRQPTSVQAMSLAKIKRLAHDAAKQHKDRRGFVEMVEQVKLLSGRERWRRD